MAETEKKVIQSEKASVSDGKNVKNTPEKNRKNVVKSAKPQKKKVVKQGGKKAAGRNSDGTFAKGNKPKITENYGRPQTDFSHRAMAKARAKKNPERILKDLDEIDKILDSDSSSPMEKMKALEIKIKLNGGFDPVENKDVTEHTIVNPFENLTEAELRKLAEAK